LKDPFFQVERPVFFLSFIGEPERKDGTGERVEKLFRIDGKGASG